MQLIGASEKIASKRILNRLELKTAEMNDIETVQHEKSMESQHSKQEDSIPVQSTLNHKSVAVQASYLEIAPSKNFSHNTNY